MMDRRRWGEKRDFPWEEEAARGGSPSGNPVSHFMILRSMVKVLSYIEYRPTDQSGRQNLLYIPWGEKTMEKAVAFSSLESGVWSQKAQERIRLRDSFEGEKR